MKHSESKFHTHRSSFKSFIEEFDLLLDPSCPSEGYLKRVYLSKLLDKEYSLPKEERRNAAIRKWLQTEDRNGETNIRIYTHDPEDAILPESYPSVTVGRLLSFCQRLIAKVIGDSPDWEVLRGSFSSGASTSIKRGVGAVAEKYLDGGDCTSACLPHFQRLNQESLWNPRIRIVPGNVLFTVPKSTTIDRCACKEPEINMYCQKAVGDFFRQQLLFRGIDLNDQSINQRLAHEASALGQLATVDLSSASDSVTTQLVIALLPFEWSSLLLDLRSPTTLVDGVLHENEMISSMGNGFTFELETLLFWALTRAACYFTQSRGRVSVYGDDIICPTSCRELLIGTLEYFGFLLNEDKSFFSGPFRESCGKHYWDGSDITPFYIRKVPVNVSDWIHLLNSLRGWLERQSIVEILDGKFFAIFKKYSKLVPRPLHGGWDCERRDILVSPGLRPLARLAPKQREHKRRARHLQDGLYLQWLNTAEFRDACIESEFEPIVVTNLVSDGELTLTRYTRPSWSRSIPVFPQELGLDWHDCSTAVGDGRINPI